MAFLSLDTFFPPRQTPLERQLAHLRREIASVSGAVRHLGGTAGHNLAHGAADIGDHFMQQGSVVARQAAKQAMRAGTAVRNDPLPTVVAIASLLLLIRLFANSGDSARK